LRDQGRAKGFIILPDNKDKIHSFDEQDRHFLRDSPYSAQFGYGN
jgi:hypothetical protein